MTWTPCSTVSDCHPIHATVLIIPGPAGLAVDVTLEQRAILVSFPISTKDHSGEPSALQLRVEPSAEEPFVRVIAVGNAGQDVQAAVQSALDAGRPQTLPDVVRVAADAASGASSMQT